MLADELEQYHPRLVRLGEQADQICLLVIGSMIIVEVVALKPPGFDRKEGSDGYQEATSRV